MPRVARTLHEGAQLCIAGAASQASPLLPTHVAGLRVSVVGDKAPCLILCDDKCTLGVVGSAILYQKVALHLTAIVHLDVHELTSLLQDAGVLSRKDLAVDVHQPHIGHVVDDDGWDIIPIQCHRHNPWCLMIQL